jgi:hypothetical protein
VIVRAAQVAREGSRRCWLTVGTIALVLGGATSAAGQAAAIPPGGRMPGESWRTDFDRHTVPLAEILPGGPPKDGIPAIDAPRFVSVDAADRWLGDREPLAVVRIGDQVRAYPLQILIWHEIVNDVVGGEPIAVTFCPLCNTTLAFSRRLDGRTLDFGTTGRLRHSDLVMYDRQTETWWQQATGEGIVGALAGRRLTFVPAPVIAWSDLKRVHPSALVLSRETGHRRDYGRNPYPGYDGRAGPIREFFADALDRRLPAMERVVTLGDERESVAIPFSVLAESRVGAVRLGAETLVVLWSPGAASAVDAPTVAEGRDVGSAAVFKAALGDRVLRFTPSAGDGGFRDLETGSRWDIAGRAVRGPLAGRQLEEVPHGEHFWFAWIAFRPRTTLIRP